MKPYPDPTLPPFLIVDDSEDDIFLLRHRLREGGITNPILNFSSPADALALLHSVKFGGNLPAIIFTDIRMPVDCGFTFLSAIRAQPGWRAIRLVVVTSSSDSADLERAIECGANGYVVKFPPSDILAEFVHHGPWLSAARQAPVLVGT
jgi:CheY-like chemotaxis protein